MTDKPCPRCTNATTPLANVNRFDLCNLHLRTIAREGPFAGIVDDWTKYGIAIAVDGKRVDPRDLYHAPDEVSELKAEIARLQDLVAKFQRGGVSTLFAEGER